MSKQTGFVKAKILQWLGVPIELTNHSFWAAWNSSQSVAGQNVNQETVMSLSAAWACTRLISETVGTLPLHVYRKSSGVRERADDHPLASIIRVRPNAESTANLFWQSMVAAMLLQGNGIAIRLMVGDRLVGLQFIPWQSLRIETTQDGRRKFGRVDSNGRVMPIADKDIFRVPGFSLDGVWGVSAISYGASVFGSALAASSAANNTFANGLSPAVYFKTDKTVRPEQREEFRKNLETVSGAMNAGKSPLLEGGMDAKTIGINPKDAQLLESRSFSVEEVCRWFGVDPSLIGHGQAVSNFGTGLEQKMISFLTFTLRPWLTRIEQSINAFLLAPEDQDRYYVEFSLEGLLRGDSAARADFLAKLTNAAIMTVDEARAKENLPPMGGNAAKLMTNGATAPIDTLGVKE